MTDKRPSFGRGLSRALPATALGLVAITGLGGALHDQPADPSAAEAATQPETFTLEPVPDSALEDPASVTDTQGQRRGVRARSTIVNASSAKDIPSPALSAYQRAATVINASDASCNLDWELIAAIARVESDHGRHGGSTLDRDGVARPSIIGVPLNGRNNTSRIADTDAGQYDGDAKFDRAVGPLQFIPSTWSMVGVDADGDGERNPQDIDDAALAAAVYLCSGNDDLGTDAGRRSAVYRYNHSQAYVTVVLDLMEKYVEGAYSANPTTTRVSASVRTKQVESRRVGSEQNESAAKQTPTALSPEAAMFDRTGTKKRGKGDTFDPVDDPGKGTEDPGDATDPFDPSEPTEPEPTDPPDPDPTDPPEPEPTDPPDPTDPPEPEPTDPPEPEPTDPPEPEVCPVVDPETGLVVDPETGEQVLDPETGEPLTVEDLAEMTDADGVSCEVPETPDPDESESPDDPAARPVS